MNEDLMNRVISQVRIRLVLHRDQDLRGCLPSGRNFVSKDGKSGAGKTGEKNDRALHLVDAERTEGVDHA